MEILDSYRIKQFLGEDRLIWNRTTNGNFSGKTTYLMLFARDQAPPTLAVRKVGTTNLILMWNFFGGGIDSIEDPREAAVREIFEEIGLKTNKEDFEALNEGDFEGAGFVYFVKLRRKISWSEIQLKEGAGVGLFSKSEILKINSTPATISLAVKSQL